MADVLPVFETMEHRWMRAWIGRDVPTLKALTSRNFRMVIGSKPATILDSKSWIEAAGTRFLCKSYRFGDVYARSHGNMVIFAGQMEIEARVAGEDWSGQLWVTDLWRKSRVRRRWQLVERLLSRPEASPELPAAIRSLQLWR
ncbi:MAG: nuclear transport factor 2 family protein [Sphingomonas sp.]|nr:nuclear transport factor 2 family protein [Sphingomonas sp.]